MNRFVVIGVDIAIIALICISLLTNGPSIKKGAAPGPPATDTHAAAQTKPR